MKTTGCAGLMAFCLFGVANLGAQPYPNRVIRLVSPYAPGGATDVMARAMAQELTKALGQNVVVENRPGAGGVIGANYVAKSTPDGYTLLLASPSPMVVLPHLNKSMPYDPFNDFAPVILLTVVPAIMAVHPSLPVKTVKDFIAFAKARPGALTYSSSGNGGTGHLAGALFDFRSGTRMTHVPYSGTSPAATAVLAGEVSLSFGDTFGMVPHVKSGRLRALAIAALNRTAMLPGIPTVAETVPGYTAGPWQGLLVAAKTPPDIIARLNKAAVGVLQSAEMKAILSTVGADIIASTPAEFTAAMREESDRWANVIREAGIKGE